MVSSGPKENDLSNYFNDTLNRKNSERFHELNNKVEIALKDEQLDEYLKLINSFSVVEKEYFKTVNEAIAQKKWRLFVGMCKLLLYKFWVL